MSELDIVVAIAKYYAYSCAIATGLLKILPTPEELVKIFVVNVPSRYYIIFYNLVRWVSGNKSWIVKDRVNGTQPNSNRQDS